MTGGMDNPVDVVLTPGGERFFTTTFFAAPGRQMGYVGGTAGPDLTRIGGIRSERDLLEAVVHPSASFVRSYEPVTATVIDGRTVNGVLRRDEPKAVVIAVSAAEEVCIPRADLHELKSGTVSLMPAGFDQQLTKQELADLVAFLGASQ